jgi:hypothetical protein
MLPLVVARRHLRGVDMPRPNRFRKATRISILTSDRDGLARHWKLQSTVEVAACTR